jgi:hypothetical protein
MLANDWDMMADVIEVSFGLPGPGQLCGPSALNLVSNYIREAVNANENPHIGEALA